MFLLLLSSPVLCSLLSTSPLAFQGSPYPNISGRRPQAWQGALGVSLGGLRLMIWLCGRQCWAKTTQQATAFEMTNRPGQETGNRKKEAGRPVHLVQWPLSITSLRHHSVTKVSWSQASRSFCSALHSTSAVFILCLHSLSASFCLSLSMHLSSQFVFSAFTLTLFSRLLHRPRHQILPSSVWE